MLTMVGLSHRNAPLTVRERFAIPGDALAATRAAVATAFGAGAILQTCNRLEMYVPGEVPAPRLVSFLAAAAGVDAGDAERYLEPRRDAEAVRHLYAVASGIDSMVLGETEILGQVRGAFSATVAASADNAVLSRLFHTAIRTGRRARNETGIAAHALSVSSVAAQQARALVDDLRRARVLVLGAGEAGRLAASSLVDYGVGQVTVCNRTAERAAALAEELGGRAASLEELDAELAAADVVIAATDSPQPLLDVGRVAAAAVRREGAPLLVIDIAVPRAAAPAIRAVPGVRYRDLDDLQAIAAANAETRAGHVPAVEALVAEETERFVEWWEHLQIVPTIAALTERAEQLRSAELAKTVRRLPVDDARRAELEAQLQAMTRALVRQILHDPIATLRERGDRDVYVEAVRRLFRLDEPTSLPDVVDGDTPA